MTFAAPPGDMPTPNTGDIHTVTRTFTRADVETFARVSGDTQDRHLVPGHEDAPDDEVLVHGLLTATLPTQIGGDLDVLASTMTFDFQKPVYTGETISCEWTTTHVHDRSDRYDIHADVVCRREPPEAASASDAEELEVVLQGSIEGLVWKDD